MTFGRNIQKTREQRFHVLVFVWVCFFYQFLVLNWTHATWYVHVHHNVNTFRLRLFQLWTVRHDTTAVMMMTLLNMA